MSACPSCGASRPPDARFCPSCGTAVEPDPTAATGAASAALWPEGERRWLSLLFCDLVGSTGLGRRLDVEDYTDLIEDYVARGAGAIESFDGYVAQVQGDGIVAYFGYPVAHEDHAERAVRAGLAIHEALTDAGSASTEVAARVGIHSGPVVVNEVGGARREVLALGDTANTAARVESLTPPGQVGLSDATRLALGGRFELTMAGQHRVKGIDHPITLYLIDAPAGSGARPGASAPPRSLLGRDLDRAPLRDAIGAAGNDRRGATIVLVGEPGIGKSHLAASALRDAEVHGAVAHTVVCSAIGSARSFGPIVDLLELLLAIPPGAAPDDAVAAVTAGLDRLGLDAEAHLSHLLDLLDLPPSGDHPLPVLGPELARTRAVNAVREVVAATASARPIVLLCEDLHWADPSTLAVLAALAEDAPDQALVLLLTTRPGGELPGAPVITVDRVDDDTARAIVSSVAGSATVAPDLVETIIERAEGVPLFIEELTAAVGESGDPSAIPATLQDSLASRLDRLGQARSLAQLASLLGREVDRDELEAVAPLDAQVFAEQLNQLVAGGVLLTDDGRRYAFKHALIQDAAAGSLVRRTRRRLHGDIVDVLAESFSTVVEDEPERLAHHCAEAGRGLDAIAHYRRGAARASARFANQEAADLLERALDEYTRLDDDDRTPLLEIELRAEYGGPLAGVHGLLGDPVAANYERIEELEAASTDVGERLAALLALTSRYPQIAAMPALVVAGNKLLEVAETLETPLFSAVGHMMCGLGATTTHPGEAEADLRHVQRLAAEGHVPPPFSEFAPDLLVLAEGTLGLVLATTGRVGEARAVLANALERAEVEYEHAFSMGTTLTLQATVHVWLGEVLACREVAARAIDLARRHGFSHFEAMNLVQHGWALTATGTDGSAMVREGLKLLTTSTMSSYPHQLSVAAMEAVLRGATREARDHIDEGLAVAEGSGEASYLSVLFRVSGWIERDEGRLHRADTELRKAHEVAASLGLWPMAFVVAQELHALGTMPVTQVRELLREARRPLVGADDVPMVVAGDALLAQLDGG